MTNDSMPEQYQLLYQPLSAGGASYVFPCDAHGEVDLDRLSERARNDYLFARAVVGRELAPPAIRSGERH
jgi:hypothetical protein